MSDANIATELDADGILLATIDMPGRAMNVFSRALMDSLEALIDRVEGDASIRGVVLTSGKAAFLAGADLEMIRAFTERAKTDTPAQLHDLCGHLGRLFRRMELSPKPFVAAINGLALGGGLEVCMACHARVVADDPKIQLGLPEIKLGLLPGAGGTQRLPRLVGAAEGLRMLLTGEPLAPQEALGLGLVHEIAPRDRLIEAAKRRARALTAPCAPWDRPGVSFSDAPYDFSKETAATAIARDVGVTDEQWRDYPAYRTIVDCVIGGWALPMTEGCRREMDLFVDLIRDPVAGNMVRTLFLNRQRAAKAGLLAADSPLAAGDDALLPRAKAARLRAWALQLSEDDRLLAVALEVARAWSEDKVACDPDLADVAVVLAGHFPAYTGGPFAWLSATGFPAVRERAAHASAAHADLFAIPGDFEKFYSPALRAA